MGNCGHCSGSCAGCTGCGGCMELTEGEVAMLRTLGQVAFLPVARKMGEYTPVYLEETDLPAEEYTLILQCLQKRGLISIDYTQPLKGFDAAAYEQYPVRGSFALTGRGQRVVELLEWQGVE